VKRAQRTNPGRRPTFSVKATVAFSLLSLPWMARHAAAQDPAAAAPAAAAPAADAPRKKRQPPPAVIPTAETEAAEQLYKSGRYEAAVAQAKAALGKNERYTPAMLVMAKSFYKLGKVEWMKKIWELMQANGASNAERAEVNQLLAFLEVDQKNTPGAIELLKKATDLQPENAVYWNNLGAQYLMAKNYGQAVPALERSTQLQSSFAKAFLNLGSAYRGAKDYEKSLAAYQRALQLFPNYADAVFNLGILYLDAEKMPNADTIAKLNTAIGYFQKYKQMMGGSPPGDPADTYVIEAQENIKKEQKRLERQKKAEEREKQRAQQKAAPGTPAKDATQAPGEAAPATGGAAPAVPAPPAPPAP